MKWFGKTASVTDKNSNGVITVYGIVFIILLFIIFSNNVACLLYGLDGTSWVIGFNAQAARSPFSQVGVDPLQGNFDAYFPAFREYFLPESLALLFTGTGAGKVLTYTVYGGLMVFATYVLACSIGISRSVGFFSGTLFAGIALPTDLSSPSWLYGIYNIVPHLAQVVSFTMIIVACFWALESKRAVTMFGLGLIAVGSVVLCVASFVTMAILMVPTIAVYGGASIFASTKLRDSLPRFVLATACVIVPAALGMAHYAIATAGYTAYNFFDAEFMQARASLGFASIVYGSGSLEKTVVCLSLVGALYAALNGPRKLTIFAWTHIIATIVFQVVALLVVVLADGYHGPSPLYFEFMAWPIMFIFTGISLSAALHHAAEILQSSLSRIARRVELITRHGLLFAVTLFLASWNVSVVAAQRKANCEVAGFFPIRSIAITEHLERTIATKVGSSFGGLVATFNGVHGKSEADWLSFHGSDSQLWRSLGNDLRLVGLWWHGIPTLIQYSPLISPPYYLLLTEFLSRPTDKQLRSVLVLTQPNERMLKLWGARFIIADFDPGFGNTRIEMPVPGQVPIRLVELVDANVGNYSPTDVRVVESFREGLRLLKDTSFDGRQTLVTEHSLAGGFVPALGARLIYQESGFSVRASSTGRSILILPIQYSRCWSVSGHGNPVLFRANMMQLAITFEGELDANLVFRFGPVFASACRIDDIKDMDRLGIRQARTR